MRTALLTALLAAVLGAALLLPEAGDTAPRPAQKGSATGPAFALVELFTSEGCSSCPPADAVLQRLMGQPGVYALAWHVDYWDRLGWPDPFASPRWTGRQRHYAEAFALNSMYTPQMVVNGRRQFVGSSESKARAAIAEALKSPASVKLSLRVERGETWVASLQAEGAPKGSVLHAVLVDGGHVIAVKRGENEGRTLRHERVVRDWKWAPGPKARLILTPPAKEPAHGGEHAPATKRILAWVQDPGGAVLAATEGR